MKTFLPTCLLLLCAYALSAQLPRPVPVNEKLTIGFHHNVEFLGFVYFIGFEGTNSDTFIVNIQGKKMLEKDWQNYGYHFYQQYKWLAQSPHLEKALTIAGELWLDEIIPLLLQVKPFPEAALTPGLSAAVYLPFSPRRDSADARKRATVFLDACNALHREAAFDRYLDSSAHWYQAAQQQVRRNLPAPRFIAAMETFYRQSMQSYQLIPSLTLPKGMGFGPRYSNSGITRVYNVFGAFEFQTFFGIKKPDMGFGNRTRMRELSVHEFGHSFVNPAIGRLPSALVRATDTSFAPIKAAMEAQGYNTWGACLTEHFVRAGEVVIARHSGHRRAARKLEKRYVQERKFIYLSRIIAALEAWRRQPGSTYEQVIEEVLKSW